MELAAGVVTAAVTTIWHVSEDDSIRRFEPRVVPDHDCAEPLVWGVDHEHVPAYWFPRDCPRATFWASAATSDGDVERFLGGTRRRVHAIQDDWVAAVRSARVVAYRLPADSFEPYDRAAGYWVSRLPVEPREVVELGDLPARHAEAGIELRVVSDLRGLWTQVVASTLEYSGVSLRNLRSA